MGVKTQELADAAENLAIERYRRRGGRRSGWFRA
jgi:hypothetical protein